MRTQEIRFDGKTYVCRIVKSNEGEDLLIGATKLLDALHPGSFEDENEGFAGKEAERLYDGIFFLHGQQHACVAGQCPYCRTPKEQSRMVQLKLIII